MALEVRKDGDVIVVSDAELPDVDQGDPETFYTLRTVTSETGRRLLKPYQKQKFDNRTHSLVPIPMTDDQQAEYTADLLDFIIVDWKGILYRGEPLACTKEHKLLLDNTRKVALLAIAGHNKSGVAAEVARNESFPESERLLPVLDR